LFGLEINK